MANPNIINCSNVTGPVTIVHTDTKCFNKCNLKYNFTSAGASVTKSAQYISIIPNNNNTTPITFSSNSQSSGLCRGGGGTKDYSVREIRIFSPSIHTYGSKDNRASGEAVLVCNNSNGGRGLIISIPITKNGNLPDATGQLSEVINYLQGAGQSGGSVSGLTLNLNSWFKVNQPFYAYTATTLIGYENGQCPTGCVDYIVYDPQDMSLGLSDTILSNLNKTIKTIPVVPAKMSTDIGYAFNSNGAKVGGIGNDVVIDCAPVNSTGQTLMQVDSQYALKGQLSDSQIDAAKIAAYVMLSSVGIFMTGLLIKMLWGKIFDYGSSSKGGVSASSLGASLPSSGGAKKKKYKK